MSAAQRFISIFSMFLLLLTLVNAQAFTESFDVYVTAPTIKVCSQSVTTQSILVKNTGSIESGYSVSTSGDASQFTAYSDSSFSLLPGQSKTIYAYITPSGRIGSYELETTITTALGESKTVAIDLSSNNCANIGLQVLTPVVTKNPCELAQFGFELTNTADHPETYEISSEGLEGYTTLSTNFVVLGPNERQRVDLFVNAACEIYGKADLKLHVYSQTNQYLATAPVTLNILQNYDYTVQIPAQSNMCNLKQVAIPIVLKNNVPFVNQYELEVRGASWVEEESEVVELGPYGTGTTRLIAAPEHPGSYLVDVLVASLRGDVVKAGTYNITVDNCYDADVNIDMPADIVIAGKTQTYPITIKNDGTKTDSYTFQLSSPTWVSATALPTTLRAGESKTFTLTAKPTNETGSFEANFISISNETGIATTDTIKFKVIAAEDAYDLKISSEHMRILYGEDVIRFKLENKGMLPGSYDFALRGPEWLKLPVTTATIQPGEVAILDVPARTTDKNQQGDYEVEFTATVKGEPVGYVSKSTVQLRELTRMQEMQLFFMRYWLHIAIAAGVLLIALFLWIVVPKVTRKYRMWKAISAEKAKLRAQAKARAKEEKLAKKMFEKALKATYVHQSAEYVSQPKKAGKFWKVFFRIILVLLALALLGGAFVAMAGYGPFVKEFLKQKSASSDELKFAPIIAVNTTGLEAYGNTVMIRGQEVIVPIIVKNNYDEDLLFGVEVDASWIKTNVEEIELEANEQEVINLRVTPRNDTNGVFVIKVSASLERENKIFSEDITLNVRQKSLLKDLLSYVWYLLAGIIAATGLIYFMKRKKSALANATGIKYITATKAAKAKPAKKITLDYSKRK